jgi:hypothetical protein
METLFIIIGSWIAFGVTVCAGFLYLMITTPVDRDEDGEEAELRVRNSMRGTL